MNSIELIPDLFYTDIYRNTKVYFELEVNVGYYIYQKLLFDLGTVIYDRGL